VRVFSRQGNDWTDRVPLIAEALLAFRVKSVTIDGEGVVSRADGVTGFGRCPGTADLVAKLKPQSPIL
jgi:bifunctional non-homologous end joining protein LigD